MTSPGTRTLKIKVDGDESGLIRSGKRSERALLGIDQQTDKTGRAALKMDRNFASASRSIIRDLDKMEREAWESGEGMDSAFSKNIRSMRAEVQRLAAEGKQTGATLDSELGGSLLRVRQQVSEMGGQKGGFLDDLIGEIPLAKAGLIGAGAAIGTFLWSGLQAEWEEDRVGALLAAQSGAAAGRAEALGDLAGDVFAKGFGASVEQVGETMSALFDSSLVNTSAPEAAIERLTGKVLTLQTTTGEGANELSRSVKQMLVTGLAENADQALDIMQRAVELGLNRFGDLMDTVQEYSTSWRDVGINGQEAMGLITQATDAGARNTDIAADALKEFGIRAQDMSVTTARGFRTLGLDAEAMGRAVANGGEPAKQALTDVLNRLKDMPPSLERNQAAIDLFGTKAEDLGDALFNMDLDDAADRFGEFSGSVVEAAQKLQNGMSGLEKFDRGVTNVKSNLGEFLDWLGSSDQMDEVQAKFQALALAQDQFMSTGDTSALEEVKQKYTDLGPAIDDYIEKNRGAAEANKQEEDQIVSTIDTMDKLIAKRKEAADGIINLASANIDWYESIDNANAAIEKNGQNLDAQTTEGRDNTKALYDLASSALSVADAMNKQGEDVQVVNGFLSQAQTEFIKTATNMGMGEQAAIDLAVRLGLIPQEVVTGYRFLSDSAIAALGSVQRQIDRIKADPVLRTDYYFYTHAMQGGGGSVRDYESSYQGGGGRATGGPVWAGQVYRVGERGEEWFKAPNTGGHIVPNHELSTSNSVDVTVMLDGKVIDAKVESRIRETNRAIKRAASNGTGRSR